MMGIIKIDSRIDADSDNNRIPLGNLKICILGLHTFRKKGPH